MKLFLVVLGNQKRYYLNVFLLEKFAILAVKFAIQKIELFSTHALTFIFTPVVVKEGCQVSRQTDNSFGRYGTRNTTWNLLKNQISNF